MLLKKKSVRMMCAAMEKLHGANAQPLGCGGGNTPQMTSNVEQVMEFASQVEVKLHIATCPYVTQA